MPSLKRRSTCFSGESGSSSWPSLKLPWCSSPGGNLVGDAAREVGLQRLLGRVGLLVVARLEPFLVLLGPGGMLVLRLLGGGVPGLFALVHGGAPRSGWSRRSYPVDGGAMPRTSPAARAHSIVRRNVSAAGVYSRPSSRAAREPS